MFDEKVLQCFLDNQSQLYPEPVAETPEEAVAFLEDCMAVRLVLHLQRVPLPFYNI